MKIEAVVVPGAHPQLNSFIEQVTNLLNNGKYQVNELDAEPDGTTYTGAFYIYDSKIYFYTSGGWKSAALT